MATKKRGSPHDEWIDKADTKGVMWATPGPYLRESMLRILARQVGHHFFPDALVTNTTFKDAPESPARPPKEEDVMGLALDVDIIEANKRGTARAKAMADEEQDHTDAEDDSEGEAD